MPDPGLASIPVSEQDYSDFKDQEQQRDLATWAQHVGEADDLHQWATGVVQEDQQREQAASLAADARKAATAAATKAYDAMAPDPDLAAWAAKVTGQTSSKPDPNGYRAQARQQAVANGLDPDVFERQLEQESGFDPNAVSQAGARGIAQFMPATAQGMGIDPTDPNQAIPAAAKLMRQHLDRYGGDYAKALAAYNAGPGAVDQAGGVPDIPETKAYVARILGAQQPGPGTAGADGGAMPAGRPAASRVEALDQFGVGLPDDQAYSVCGPVAALAFAQANGRNPTLDEARQLAQQVGWTPQGGMNGVQNEAALLERMGVKSRLDTNPDFGQIAADASSGNPVIVSTAKHYYYVNGYDPQTGKLHVGKTGTARIGGAEWMSAQEIANLDGGINGALYVDNPNSPQPSVAAEQGYGGTPLADDQTDVPAEEGYGGTPLETGAMIGQPQAQDQRDAPDPPSIRPPPLLVPSPFGPVASPLGPPIQRPKYGPPDYTAAETTAETGAPIRSGEDIVGGGAAKAVDALSQPLDTSSAGAFLGSLAKVALPLLVNLIPGVGDQGKMGSFVKNQGQTLPGVMGEMVSPEHGAEEAVRASEQRGGFGSVDAGLRGAVAGAGDVLGAGGQYQRDFAAEMEAAKAAAARRRALGLPEHGKNPGVGGPTGMRAYDDYMAEQEAHDAAELAQRLNVPAEDHGALAETIGNARLGSVPLADDEYTALVRDSASGWTTAGDALTRGGFTVRPEADGTYALTGPGGHIADRIPSLSDAQEMAHRLEQTGADLSDPRTMRLALAHVLNQQDRELVPTALPPEVLRGPRAQPGAGTPLEAERTAAAPAAPAPDAGAAVARGAPAVEPRGTEDLDAAASAADLSSGLRALRDAGVTMPEARLAEASTAPPSSAGFRQFWDRARNVIARQGDAGQELAQKLHDWRETAETMAGDWTTRMQAVRDLGAQDFRNFVDAAEGKAEPANGAVAKALGEWDAIRGEVYQRAQDAGLDIGHLENYFPHVFEDGAFKGKGWQASIDHLIASGQAADEGEAAQMLRYAQDVRRNRRYGNLESERLADLPFYKRTKDVLFGSGGYLEAAANRIAQVETFGPKDADALALVNRIAREGGDAGAAKALFDISVGATKYGELQQKASRIARSFNTVSSLGLSAINNASQSVNTVAVAGLGPTLRNVLPVLRSPAAKEYAVKAGVTLDNVVQDVREGTGLSGRVLGAVTAPFFSPVERFNRTLALHAGIGYAEDAAAKAAAGNRGAVAALDKLGLDGTAIAARGTLTDAEKITAGRSMVERTQFKVDPQDLPGWSSSPWGKVVTQFKAFSYNQSAFMGREIIGPALRGNVGPLTRFLLAGLLAGAATTETRNVLQGRESEQDPVKRILQYYNAVGGLGLAGDALRIVGGATNINGDRLDPQRQVSQAVGTVAGPTVGKAMEAFGGIAQATQPPRDPALAGNQYKPIERTLLRQIPVVGTTLQNLLVPYTGPKQAAATSSGPPKPPAPPKPPRPPSAAGRR